MIRYLRSVRNRVRARLEPPLAAYRLRRALRERQSDLRIIIGASGSAFPGWVATEYPLVNVADKRSLEEFFAPASVQAILAEHVWEHLTPEQARAGARNAYWLLKSGGYLRIAVPDGLHPAKEYVESVKPGGHGAGSDDHKVLYTNESLVRLLEGAGFRTALLEWFDESGRFHFQEWDPAMGHVLRSTRFDDRNRTNPTAYTSLIADARKD